jgi:hypothetical protein
VRRRLVCRNFCRVTGGLGWRLRDRRAFVLAFSVLLVVGVVVAAVALKPDRPRHRSATAPRPTATPSSAPFSWVADLAPRIALSTPVLLEDEVLYPGAGRPVSGVEGVVTAATPFHGGLLVTWSLPDRGARLSFLTDRGKLEDFAGATTFGHAVDSTGTRVAFGSDEHEDMRVVRAGNAKVLLTTKGANLHGLPGTAVAWWGEKVLITSGDGADVRAFVWDTGAREVDPVGSAGRFSGVFAVAGDLGVMRQGDSGCSETVDLATGTRRWATCDRFAGTSPAGRQVLLEGALASGGSRYQVRDAATGRTTATLALPSNGVVATGWGSEDAVVAVVRFVADGAESWVIASCPTTGARCHRVHEHSLGSANGPAARLAFVVTARP